MFYNNCITQFSQTTLILGVCPKNNVFVTGRGMYSICIDNSEVIPSLSTTLQRNFTEVTQAITLTLQKKKD